MKTPAHLLLVSLVSVAACAAPEPAAEEPAETTEDAITSAEAQRPIRQALFESDAENDIWFVCKSGSGRHATTFVIASNADGSEYPVTATYQKASYFTGYVTANVRLGKATLSGTYPHRFFSFAIGGKAARLDTTYRPDGTKPSLTLGGQTRSVRCEEYDAPYDLDSAFGG